MVMVMVMRDDSCQQRTFLPFRYDLQSVMQHPRGTFIYVPHVLSTTVEISYGVKRVNRQVACMHA